MKMEVSLIVIYFLPLSSVVTLPLQACLRKAQHCQSCPHPLKLPPFQRIRTPEFGEVAEWLNVLAWKVSVRC